MRKFGLIVRNEYLRNVRRRSFLLATIGMPLMIIALMAVSILNSEAGRGDADTLGYVDQSGVLAAHIDDPGFRAFSTVEEATAVLGSGDIRGFYVLARDYPTSGKVELLYWDRRPGENVVADFDTFLKANLVGALAPQVAERALSGPEDVTVRAADGSRETDSPGVMSFILPFALGLFISFALMSASSYLMLAVTDEKENRTIEIMTTSVSPKQLIAGKSVGLAGVALTQVIIWAAVVVIGLAIASRFTDALSGMAVSGSLILVLAAFFVPLFALAVALVVTLGVAVVDSRQGQQLAGGVSILFLLPLFFSSLLGSSPDGTVMVVLTLFPTTSLLTIAMRWSATVIPLWQLVASWVILAVCAGVGFWAAPRVFRQGMLRYGKRMTMRGVLDAVRARG